MCSRTYPATPFIRILQQARSRAARSMRRPRTAQGENFVSEILPMGACDVQAYTEAPRIAPRRVSFSKSLWPMLHVRIQRRGRFGGGRPLAHRLAVALHRLVRRKPTRLSARRAQVSHIVSSRSRLRAHLCAALSSPLASRIPLPSRAAPTQSTTCLHQPRIVAPLRPEAPVSQAAMRSAFDGISLSHAGAAAARVSRHPVKPALG